VSKLEEIKAAAESLSQEEKQELMLFPVTRLRSQVVKVPEPRKSSSEQMAAWAAEDEADMTRFRDGR
jgi:hypothetical protein